MVSLAGRAGGIHLELFAQYPLDALTAEECRYYFYQCLLDEQAATIQESMVQHVHHTSSRKEVRKYVQDHQQDLLTYASEVLGHLNEVQAPIYAPVEDYSLPDVYRLIYSNLEALMDFLEQQFSQYLDQTAKVAGIVDPAPLERPSDKIKTNLSVPQIALLLRMFLDPKVDIFPKQNREQHLPAAQPHPAVHPPGRHIREESTRSLLQSRPAFGCRAQRQSDCHA